MPFDGTGYLRDMPAPATDSTVFLGPASAPADAMAPAPRRSPWRTLWTSLGETLFPVVEEHTLSDLSALLRAPSRWPRGFTWDYVRPSSCAMGLCNAAYGRSALHHMAPSYNAPGTELGRIFYQNGNRGWMRGFSATTPTMVADDIDAHLAGTFGRGAWKRALPF